jgi:hypothetical protein
VAGVILGLGVFLCHLAVGRASVYSYDGNIMYALARNLVQHGTLVTTGQEPFSHDPWNMNTPYSVYGLGTSLLVAPATALELLFDVAPFLFVTLVSPLVLAVTAVVIQRIGAGLGWDLRLATLAGAVVALATPLLWAGTELFSETPIVLCTALVVLAAIRWRDGRSWAPFVFGASIGAAIQFRTDSVLLLGLAVAVLPLFMPVRRLLADRTGLLLAGLPVAASVALVVWYNLYRFGTVVQPPYGGVGFTTPILTGVGGLLVSPGKGLFVFAPILLLGLVGLVPLVRRDRAVFVLIVVLTTVRVAFFAKWGVWHGGLGWGPRFILPVCVLLIIPAGEAVRADRHWPRVRVWRLVAVVLVALSVGISALSVSVPYEQWWWLKHDEAAAAGPDALADFDRMIHWDPSESHIVGSLRLLAGGNAWPVAYWWQNGRSWIGPLALFGGCISLIGALCAPRAGRSARARSTTATQPLEAAVAGPAGPARPRSLDEPASDEPDRGLGEHHPVPGAVIGATHE